MGLTKRQRTAIAAATRIAKSHGVALTAPRLLRDSSFVTVQLSPTLLARVRIRNGAAGELARIRRELSVARFLSRREAPAVRPSREIPPGPHIRPGVIVTFWKFEPVVRGRKADAAARLGRLMECHRALAHYPGRLPSFLADMNRCRRLLMTRHGRRHLSAANHRFLLDAYAMLRSELQNFSYPEIPLHGDGHWGNALPTRRGVIWCDFESVCRGPREWDLAFWPRPLAAAGRLNPRLLELLRNLVSWRVAGWCWMAYDLAGEKREAAHYHLGRLKKKLAGQISGGR